MNASHGMPHTQSSKQNSFQGEIDISKTPVHPTTGTTQTRWPAIDVINDHVLLCFHKFFIIYVFSSYTLYEFTLRTQA